MVSMLQKYISEHWKCTAACPTPFPRTSSIQAHSALSWGYRLPTTSKPHSRTSAVRKRLFPWTLHGCRQTLSAGREQERGLLLPSQYGERKREGTNEEGLAHLRHENLAALASMELLLLLLPETNTVAITVWEVHGTPKASGREKHSRWPHQTWD